MIQALTPISSSARTVKRKISGWLPVSASYMRGFLVTSMVSRTSCSRIEVSTTSISGLPFETDAVREDDHNASNSFPSTRTVSAITRFEVYTLVARLESRKLTTGMS